MASLKGRDPGTNGQVPWFEKKEGHRVGYGGQRPEQGQSSARYTMGDPCHETFVTLHGM